jgi:hypothetical protein
MMASTREEGGGPPVDDIQRIVGYARESHLLVIYSPQNAMSIFPTCKTPPKREDEVFFNAGLCTEDVAHQVDVEDLVSHCAANMSGRSGNLGRTASTCTRIAAHLFMGITPRLDPPSAT